ncbi:hypothetical protein PQU92_00060 [Asticcacaulis sp. BYS171W]|uniref:Uncharacterized protein n=1 Tax=Asticcacaulis aquaticus TaxID=2984212 RepID=A0ABT5HNM0_9CAUL|nr:hypothetical protein [Asticcacaulis aquaticus]MDC7681656.1 hypothetical protein [Asticcacaulis aquaticus]
MIPKALKKAALTAVSLCALLAATNAHAYTWQDYDNKLAEFFVKNSECEAIDDQRTLSMSDPYYWGPSYEELTTQYDQCQTELWGIYEEMIVISTHINIHGET